MSKPSALALAASARNASDTATTPGKSSRLGTVLIVVISVSFNILASAYKLPHWLGTVALVVMGMAIAIFVLQSPTFTRRVPWELRRKDPINDLALLMSVNRMRLRRELQRQFGAFNALDKPTPAQLRSSAHAMEQTLIGAGFKTSAKDIEVHLADNADQAAVTTRKGEIFLSVGRMLMWDEFQG